MEVLQEKSPVLYFFLLVLGVFFNFTLDAIHEGGRLAETLMKKSFEFVPNRKNSIVAFHLSFVLLPVIIDPFPEE